MIAPIDPGLCGSCAHARVLTNRAGSTFHLCQLSREDCEYPRYPRLPILRCDGYRRATAVHGPGEMVKGSDQGSGAG